MRLRLPLTLAVAALAVAACDTTRPVASRTAATTCTRCHGGAEDQTGAPPRDASGRADPTLPSVGAHRAHVAAGLDCDACHVKPPVGDSSHVDGDVAVVFGPLATSDGALLARYDDAGAAPTYTCASVYCHGAFEGGNATVPRWTAPGGGDAACGTCHALPPGAPHPAVANDLAGCSACHSDTVTASGQLVRQAGGAHVNGRVNVSGGHPAAWMDPGSAGFHAAAADAGLAACQGCHGADLGGGPSGVGCGECHDASLPAGVASWRVNCVMCHGGVESGTGAPPRATWGNAGDPIRVGAHTAHLTPSAVSPGFDCGVCHVKPADALSPGHVGGGTATVAFAGRAVSGEAPAPAWDRDGATCSNTYCHGAQMGGATPVWTRVGEGEAACGTCHGTPPTLSHPAVSGGLAACSTCHAPTIDSTGALIPPSAGGTHLNGVVDAQGHGAEWLQTGSSGFHAFSANRNLDSCTGCHGADLAGGGSGVACGDCHDAGLPAGVSSWKVNCVMCHGGAQNATGAPPKATWGNAGDPARGGGTADPIRVGAHTAHVSPSAVSPGFGCDVCHVKPAAALAPDHANGTARVAFAGIAANGVTPAPAWSRDTATCSNTYCHGAQDGATPVWTQVGQGEGACGTCHGLPPTVSHPAVSGGLTACSTCHAPTIAPTGVLIPPGEGGKHLNGAVDAQGHGASWMDTASPGFHAFSANRDAESCTGCHSTAPGSSSTARSCDRCHELPAGMASWIANCVMCHGGEQNATGAPPRATWGNAGDPLRVGAHSKHVGATLSAPIGCGACHPQPQDVSSPGHLGDGTADVTWGGVAVAGGAQPVWNRGAGTCATTYCHGNYSGTYTYSNWDYATEEEVFVEVPYAGNNATPRWTDAGTTCGSCHGNPPPGNWHLASHGTLAPHRRCELCHPDALGDNATGGSEITAPGRHADGVVDVTPQFSTSGCKCHF
jgi:predicted CxxxxCH...CXXCH cytochrome family protein